MGRRTGRVRAHPHWDERQLRTAPHVWMLPPVKSIAPGFLIAVPQLGDPHFQRSVVFMLEHGEGGSMGLIINRRSPVTLGELASTQGLSLASVREPDVVQVGGPVEPQRGFVLHDWAGVEERQEVLPGLYLSLTIESLKSLLADPGPRLKFFLGYSGWGPGQLDRELAQGGWLFTEANERAVLDGELDALWDGTIREMGLNPLTLVPGGGVN